MNKELSKVSEQGHCPESDSLSENEQSIGSSRTNLNHAILLVDDNPAVAQAMEIAFRMIGHALDVASDPEEAFSRLARRPYDAILLDLNFTARKADGQEGLACLMRIVAEDPAACVVVLTAHGGVRTAVTAMQLGARDFAIKPWKNAELIAKVEAAIARGSGRPSYPPTPGPESGPPRLLGQSDAVEELRSLIQRVGPTSAGVAITGPSGAGRTLTALALNAVSAHASRAPLRIDLRDTASWSQLQSANGCVILRHPDRLDEIAQDRLAEHLPSAVRPIAITDSIGPLTPALLRRIATAELVVPPLAERREDIPLLARHFIRAASDRFDRSVPRLTEVAEAAIRAAHWPDEVRGLALAMERAVLLADDGVIDVAALSLYISSSSSGQGNLETTQRKFDLDGAERTMIEAALREHRHNITHAAKVLGLSRGALYRRMERHGL